MGTKEADVSTLTNEELAERLKAVGETHGPITPTTRLQYERKLKRRLTLQNAANCTITYSLPQTELASDGAQKHPETAVECEKIAESNADDLQGPFYSVRLPPNAPPSNGINSSSRVSVSLLFIFLDEDVSSSLLCSLLLP